MGERSFPFPAVDNDRLYGAADWAAYFSQVISNGVFPVGSQLQATAGTGMQVNVSAGGAWINGYGYVNGSTYTLNIDAADGVLNRIDRIIVRWGRVERAIFLDVLKGTPASSPSAPALIRDADYYDLCITEISIPAGITEITGTHITDKRLDPVVCGIVSSLITPDTSGWYEGWEAEFQTWLAGVQGLLEGDPATQIAAAVAELQVDMDDAQESISTLEAANAVLTTAGTPPNFIITPSPAIEAYAGGQTWTVRFHADGESPTLNVSGKGAGSIYTSDGKAAKVKSGQIVRVMRYGTGFFTLSGGGGVSLPQTIGAGETVLYCSKVAGSMPGYFTPIITVLEAGTYRFLYSGTGSANVTIYLTQNGTQITGSSVTGGRYSMLIKTLDVVCAAGDVIRLYGNRTSGEYGYFGQLTVSILAVDLQTELNNYLVIT